MTKKVKHILFSSAHIVDFPHIFWTFLKGKISDYSDQNQEGHGSYLDGKKNKLAEGVIVRGLLLGFGPKKVLSS